MTCKDIFDLYASDTEKSDLCDAYRNVPLDSRDEIHKNNTPLHTACYFADITAVAILLERGADTNVRNDDGDTPLCVMAKRNSCPNDTLYADISGLLLSKGAKVTRSGKNTTALIEAVRNRHFLMADVLLMTGNRIDSTDWNGDNVLHAICDSAGYIANNIKSRKKRIADFAERWYSDKDKQETYLPYCKDYSGKRADRFGGKKQLRENTLSYSSRKRRLENWSLAIRTRTRNRRVCGHYRGIKPVSGIVVWGRRGFGRSATFRCGYSSCVRG